MGKNKLEQLQLKIDEMRHKTLSFFSMFSRLRIKIDSCNNMLNEMSKCTTAPPLTSRFILSIHRTTNIVQRIQR